MPRCRTAVAGRWHSETELSTSDHVMSFVPVYAVSTPGLFLFIPPHLLYVSFIYANINTDVGRNAESLSLQSEFNCGFAGMTQTLLLGRGRPCDKTVMDEFGYSILTQLTP